MRAAELTSPKPWIQLTIDAEFLEDVQKNELVEELANAVGARGFELALEEQGRPDAPIANITLKKGTDVTVSVHIEIADEVTTKTLGRVIDLRAVPRETRATTIALSADELLLASWAELNIKDAPVPALEELPPQVVEAVEETTINGRDDSSFSCGLGASGGIYSSNWMGLGLDVRLTMLQGSRIQFMGHLTWQRSPTYESNNAQTRTDLFRGGAGLIVEFTEPRRPLGIGTVGLLEVGGLHFSPRAKEGFNGKSVTKFVVLGNVSLIAWLEFVQFLRPFWQIGLAIPFRGTEGRDGEQTIAKLNGIGAETMLGICFSFGG